MVVYEVSYFWSADDRGAIGRAMISIWASLGDKRILWGGGGEGGREGRKEGGRSKGVTLIRNC